MIDKLVVTTLLVLVLVSHVSSDQSSDHGLTQQQASDPNKLICGGLAKLDVLPGAGWNNLVNEECGHVVTLSYDQCKTTEDGRYLIPDNAYVVPVKQSDVQLYSDVIDNWSNYSSLTSRSFNLNAGIDLPKFSISGSYSHEYRETKQRQVDQKSITFRVYATYTVYEVILEPTAKLHQDFLARLNLAKQALAKNQTAKADYLLELMVRDYGTHVTTHNYAGAIVSKEDFVTRSYASQNTEKITDMKVAASASFIKIFSFGANYETKTDEQTAQGYIKSMTSSHVKSVGGALFKPNGSISEWISTVPTNLASIDRKGASIFSLITPFNFPNENLTLIELLRKRFKSAVSRFYRRNEHLGCMSMDAPNFDFNANLDNKLCREPFNNYSFGGVYQKCQNDLCTNYPARKNPITGDFTCPTYFEPIVLRSNSYQSSWESCSGWWIFKSCGWNYKDNSFATVWCAALPETIPNNTGVMFGGLFTSTANNPVTLDKSCPPTYIDMNILHDLHVCISTDYELGRRYSIPFGGFFSCNNGNPLYTRLKALVTLLNLKDSQVTDQYVHGCPNGYTQHSAIIDQECLVYYCVKAGSFSLHGQMPVIWPPYHKAHVIFDEGPSSNDATGHGLSPWSIIGIVLGSICLLALMIGAVLLRRRRASSHSQQGYIAVNGDDDNGGQADERVAIIA